MVPQTTAPRAARLYAFCLLTALGTLALPVQGQGRQEVPTLEVWQGNRRATTPGAKVLPLAPISTPTPPAISLEPPEPIQTTTLPAIEPAPVPMKAFVPPKPSEPVRSNEVARPAERGSLEELQGLIHSTRQLTDECRQVIKKCRASVPAPRHEQEAIVTPRPMPSVPAQAPSIAPTPTSELPASPKEPTSVEASAARAPVTSPDGISWVQLAILAGAVLVSPVVVVLALTLFLRKSGMQFRVEVINSGPPGSPPQIVLMSQPGAPYASTPATEAIVEDGNTEAHHSTHFENPEAVSEEPALTGEAFDLGPTYEEERQAKEEALRAQEMAVLQQIFEENCRLQEELCTLESIEEQAE